MFVQAPLGRIGKVSAAVHGFPCGISVYFCHNAFSVLFFHIFCQSQLPFVLRAFQSFICYLSKMGCSSDKPTCSFQYNSSFSGVVWAEGSVPPGWNCPFFSRQAKRFPQSGGGMFLKLFPWKFVPSDIADQWKRGMEGGSTPSSVYGPVHCSPCAYVLKLVKICHSDPLFL